MHNEPSSTSEKQLIASPGIKITECIMSGLKMVSPRKPPGTLPVLVIDHTRHITQSIAILEYFEDLCDEAEKDGNKKGLYENAGPTMRGKTAVERARTREIVVLAEEATTQFSFAAHKSSAMFTLLEEQDPKASRLAMEGCKKTLALLEKHYKDDF